MKRKSTRALAAAVVGLAMAGTATISRADFNAYEFQLVERSIKANPEAVITVCLVNEPTGQETVNANDKSGHTFSFAGEWSSPTDFPAGRTP